MTEAQRSDKDRRGAKARVLRRYPTAKAVKWKNGWCIHRIPKGRGVSTPLDNCWMRLEAQAWIRADWRLNGYLHKTW